MNPRAPDISVVIPVHNGERYLSQSLESVFAQEFDALEVLVIDNGSTDATARVARDFPRVQYLHLPEKGLVRALNHGVERSRGAFLAFLDADDLWLPGKLAIQLNVFEQDTAVDMVFGHVEQFLSPELTEAEKASLNIRQRVLPGRVRGTLLIRKSRFEQVGPFGHENACGEFIDWYMRARDCPLTEVMLPDVLLRRRVHGRNMGYTERDRRIDYVRLLKRGLDRRRRQGGA